MQGACKLSLGRSLEVMYVYSILPPISTEAMRTGEHATHKNPSPKKRENVHTQMLHLVNRNRKTYQTKKEKNDPKTTVQYAGEYISMPKKP